MHPVLFYWKVPATWLPYFGPQSQVYSFWKILAGAFVVAFLAWMWATNPERKTPRTLWVWLSGLAVLVLGLPLSGLGLVRIGEIKLHTYGVMLSTAFIVGILLAVREAQRVGESPEKILDLTFWILVSSIIGARVLYILTTWHEYSGNLIKLTRVWEGGLVYYGGLIGATLFSWWFMRRNKMDFLKVSDILIPSVVLGQAFGRLGCFSAGCCYGKVAHAGMSWAVKFPSPPASLGGWIHPTQLYEASANLMVFFILLLIRSRKRFHGAVLVGYLVCYSILRFFIEIVRGDKGRGYLFRWDVFPSLAGPEFLSTSQVVSICLIFLAVGIVFWQRKKNAVA